MKKTDFNSVLSHYAEKCIVKGMKALISFVYIINLFSPTVTDLRIRDYRIGIISVSLALAIYVQSFMTSSAAV